MLQFRYESAFGDSPNIMAGGMRHVHRRKKRAWWIVGALFALDLAGGVGISAASFSYFFPTPLRAAGIAVPFVLQAPYSKWVQPYEDACEEAVMVMLDAWARGDTRDRIPADEANRRILEIVALEREVLGYGKDTSIAEMIRLINEYGTFWAYAVRNPSIEDIKAEIDRGQPVAVPVWGKMLMKANPYFSRPGPTYHTILVTGYDDAKKQFIVQEPGVGRGRNYRYPYNVVMDGMADLKLGEDGRPVAGGERFALFVRLQKTQK